MAETDKMWYFSYGSNINPEILSGRRKVYPTESKPCVAPGWYLNFDTLGLPYVEPSFASIGKKPLNGSQPEVHGVVHKITRKDYDQIRRTEGGGGHENIGYCPLEIQIKCYDGQQVTAFTLVQCESPVRIYHDTFYPSKRYMKLIEDGAEVSGLKPSYQQWLKTVPRYEHIPTLRHLAGKSIFLALAILFFIPLLSPMLIRFLFRARGPRFIAVVSNYFAYGLRHLYHFVFLPIFGPGAREPVNSKKLD